MQGGKKGKNGASTKQKHVLFIFLTNRCSAEEVRAELSSSGDGDGVVRSRTAIIHSSTQILTGGKRPDAYFKCRIFIIMLLLFSLFKFQKMRSTADRECTTADGGVDLECIKFSELFTTRNVCVQFNQEYEFCELIRLNTLRIVINVVENSIENHLISQNRKSKHITQFLFSSQFQPISNQPPAELTNALRIE